MNEVKFFKSPANQWEQIIAAVERGKIAETFWGEGATMKIFSKHTRADRVAILLEDYVLEENGWYLYVPDDDVTVVEEKEIIIQHVKEGRFYVLSIANGEYLQVESERDLYVLLCNQELFSE